MAVASIDLLLGGSSITPFTQRLTGNLTQFREVRERILRDFAALDAMRDNGAVTIFMAEKLGAQGVDGAAKIAEATKLFDELSSLVGKISSEAPDTLGTAALQICAKLGI